jgi:hypothetical protein
MSTNHVALVGRQLASPNARSPRLRAREPVLPEKLDEHLKRRVDLGSEFRPLFEQ